MIISYGHRTSGELLLSYGFCPAGTNPHDACQLEVELPAAGGSELEWRTAALARHGLGARQAFPLRMNAVPWGLPHWCAFAAAPVGSAAEAAALADAVFGADSLPPALQRPALEEVVARCQAALVRYPSTLDQQRAELEALQAVAAEEEGTAGRRRRRDVLRVLVQERQILHRTVFLLQQELRDLKRLRL